ncbi:MAG: helix-turn-helix transcriptional regulator [Solirubrobacterales bacterium]|nr:helix-turn-helix transcriptional regulator [Solirubrobacterales bacterium]
MKSEQDRTTVDVKLMKALGHPIRQRILHVLTEHEESSPSEVARIIGESVNTVSYHFRILKKCDAIELVRKEIVGTTVIHLYRAKVRAVADEENWRHMPEPVRETLLDETLQQIWSNVRAASDDEGLKDLRTAIAWNVVSLDEEGFTEASRKVASFVYEIMALESGAEQRLAALDPEERESKTRLVEIDTMLYPIKKVPAPRDNSRQSQSGSGSTGSKST